MDEGFILDEKTECIDLVDIAASADRGEVKPRVIQYQGKRYGIRMEDCFWHVLEREAEARGYRLNRLVHEIYTMPEAARNRTAYLREHAMEWMANQFDRAKEDLELDRSQITNILRMTRRPALLVNNDLGAARFNRAFREWFGEKTAFDTAYGIESVRVSFRASRRVLEERLADAGGFCEAEPAAILFPGRAIPLQLDITQLSGGSDQLSMMAVFHEAID